MRRCYGYCAKCGSTKDLDPGYVGTCCVGTPGLYKFCAVGGDRLMHGPQPYLGRNYVCNEHLA
jgi:hypothetical protein